MKRFPVPVLFLRNRPPEGLCSPSSMYTRGYENSVCNSKDGPSVASGPPAPSKRPGTQCFPAQFIRRIHDRVAGLFCTQKYSMDRIASGLHFLENFMSQWIGPQMRATSEPVLGPRIRDCAIFKFSTPRNERGDLQWQAPNPVPAGHYHGEKR